jgi:hypothetical protein
MHTIASDDEELILLRQLAAHQLWCDNDQVARARAAFPRVMAVRQLEVTVTKRT